MATLLRLLGSLPLTWLHTLGSVLGRLAYRFHGKTRGRQDTNLAFAAPFLTRVPSAQQVAAETGKQAFEFAWLWRADYEKNILPRLEIDAKSAATIAAPGATIFLTPHIGPFEVAGYYIAHQRALAALYRKPRVAALDEVMRRGRNKGQCETFPADLSGVRALMKALKRGEAIGILPDQTPSNGEGGWVPFFGKPAYTMTLIAALAQKTGARLVMCICIRNAGNFRLQADELPSLPAAQFDGDLAPTAALNAHVENAIARCPEQYLWSYNRYKQPGGAPPPPIENA